MDSGLRDIVNFFSSPIVGFKFLFFLFIMNFSI